MKIIRGYHIANKGLYGEELKEYLNDNLDILSKESPIQENVGTLCKHYVVERDRLCSTLESMKLEISKDQDHDKVLVVSNFQLDHIDAVYLVSTAKSLGVRLIGFDVYIQKPKDKILEKWFNCDSATLEDALEVSIDLMEEYKNS